MEKKHNEEEKLPEFARYVTVHVERPATEEELKAIKKKKKKKRRKHSPVRNVLRALLTVFLLIVAISMTYIMMCLKGVPELDLSKRDNYSTASIIQDSNGTTLMSYGEPENITWVSGDAIPTNLKNAFVAIEDKRFYEHHGVDIKRTAGAIWGQLSGTADYGGSTITQQLIKNQYLSSERTYRRKIREMYLALRLEQQMSKDDILTWYINTCFFGGNIYGAEHAAENWFGKSVSELSLRECAAIAGTVQTPNVLSPRICADNGDMTPSDTRTATVLYEMYSQGMISYDEYQSALNEQTVLTDTPLFTESTTYTDDYYANAYFIDYAIDDICNAIAEADNPKAKEITSDMVEAARKKLKSGGYTVQLSLDTSVQKAVQNALSNYRYYPTAKNGTKAEASAVVIDQHTGRIIAMVGGRNQQTTIDGFNRAVDSTQGVGSSIKPLSVYAPALDLGDYPGTTVMDTKTPIEGYDSEKGYPDGDAIGGPITMRRALELSHNIPAVRFLLDRVTLNKSFSYMVKNGFDESHLSKTAAGIGLGATDVTTLEMTAGYATLANGGVYIKPHTYITIADRDGNKVLDDSKVESHRVFKESTAWLITDMMETNMTNGLGVNARLNNVKSAGKTGTNEHKAITFGGYTPYYTSFLRISLDDYSDFTSSSAYRQAAPLWKNYMDPIESGASYDSTKEIQTKTADMLGIKKYYVCKNSGLLATDLCINDGYAYEEYATAATAPTEYCSHHTYGGWDGGANGEADDTQVATSPDDGYWDMDGNWHGPGWWDTNGWHAQ